MPRPAVKEERTNQILDAFDRCVTTYGYGGTTLEHVAKEAGLARALIRHNVGNREDLIAAGIERFMQRSGERWEQLFEGLPESGATRALCERLFDSEERDDQLVLLTQAVMTHAASDPALTKHLSDWLAHSIAAIAEVVRHDNPALSEERAYGLAGGILSVYFNLASFQLIGDLPQLEGASSLAVEILLEAVEG